MNAQRPPSGGPSTALSTDIATIAAAVVAVLATTWAVLAGGWTEGAEGTLLVAAVGFAEAALLARSALPRVLALLLAPILAAAIILPVTASALPPDVATGGALYGLGRYIDAAFTGLLSTDPWTFAVGLAACLWGVSAWLGWWLLRERRGVIAVVPALLVLAINVLNAPNRDSEALPVMVSLAGLLLCAGGAQLGRLLEGWRWRRLPALPLVGRRFAGSLLLTVTLAIAGAVVIPPVSNHDYSGHLFGGGGDGTGGGFGTGGNGTGWDTQTVAFDPNTQPGGPLRIAPQPVLRYTTDAVGSVYLRVVTDPVFDAGNWYVAGYGGRPVGVAAYPGGDLPRDRSVAAGGVGEDAAKVTLNITAFLGPEPTGATSYGIFPGDPDSLDHPGTVVGMRSAPEGPFLSVDEVNLNRAPDQIAEMVSTGWLSTASADRLRAAGMNYPAFVRQEDMALPDDGSGGVRAITTLAQQWTEGTTTPYDRASAIENHLRDTSQFRYTLSPPQPPIGEWPIVYFLTTSHRGYCQYFASAMGAMLRSLGIPARLVAGYGPGTEEEQGGARATRVLRDVGTQDAHVWVEAYFPGQGWVSFEPTPPSILGDYVPFQRGAQITPGPSPTAGSTPSASAAPTPTPEVAPAPTPSSPGGGPRLGAWTLAPAAAALLIAIACGLVLWWRRPPSLAGAWSRLLLLGRAAGVRRLRSETRAAFSARLAGALAQSSSPDVTGAAAELAAVAGRAEFGRAGLGDADARRWRAAWAVLARSHPLRARRRRRRAG